MVVTPFHVRITMQSYNIKSNKVGKQHLYHSTCTPPHSLLVLCIVIKYIIMALIIYQYMSFAVKISYYHVQNNYAKTKVMLKH